MQQDVITYLRFLPWNTYVRNCEETLDLIKNVKQEIYTETGKLD